MRMDEMNKMFEDRGFTVERKYENCGYRFTISKDGNYRTERFVYPSGVSSRYASQIQRDFVKDMIARFYKDFPFCDENARTSTIDPKFTHKPLLAADKINELVDGIKAFDLLYPDKFYIDTDVRVVDIQVKQDFDIQKEMYKFMNGNGIEIMPLSQQRLKPRIKNVIFNDPATIVFWSDGSKTVVKCQDDDVFDPEKGLAMAISKKALGNKGNYCNELKKWLPEEEEFESLDVWKIKIPQYYKQVSDIQKMVYAAFGIKKDTKLEAVQKAYDALVGYRDKDKDFDLDELIGYLGEALED